MRIATLRTANRPCRRPSPRAAAAWIGLALSAALPGSAWAGDGSVTPIDKELEKYWNVEQAVPSLQNPLYERKGGVEATLYGGMVPNDSYFVPISAGGRIGFFVTDTLALEGGFSYLVNAGRAPDDSERDGSELREFLVCANKQSAAQTVECVDLAKGAKQPPHLKWLASANVHWTPVHGKIGIFAAKVASFDLGFNLGLGIVNGDFDPSDIEAANQPGEKGVQPALRYGAHWGAGFRFFLTRWANVRLDYRQTGYRAGNTYADDGRLADSLWQFPAEITLGVAFLSK